MILDDIHGRHGQTGSVDETANIAIQFDVAKPRVGRANLSRFFFVQISQFFQVGVAKESVVVEGDFSIQRDHLPVFGDHQRIDLGHRAVEIDEELAKLFEKTIGALGGRTGYVQFLAKLANLKTL